MSSKYERIAIPSSGDPEEDARELAQARRHSALMDEGMCPNGCGPRVASAEWQGCSECPKCGFFCDSAAVTLGDSA